MCIRDRITTGPRTKQFERETAGFCGAERAVCLSSATAALELTLRILGIGEGDEVITSAYTYTASASVICHVGARPVLVDTAKDSYFMDYGRLEDAITPRTKAVIPVDIAGIPCDYQRIFSVAEHKKGMFSSNNPLAAQLGRIAVITDAAHALGAAYCGKSVGSIADFTCFSFHAVKNLTTAEGGAVVFSGTNGKDVDEIYKKYMLFSLHGQTKDALAKTGKGSWEYDIVTPGYKCNMTDIMAAIGLVQLARYPGMLSRRKEMVARYDKAFAGSSVVPVSHSGPKYESSRHPYLTRLAGRNRAFRDKAIAKLAEKGIAANVHYKPLPMLTAYKNMGFSIEDYPNALAQFENELTLPLHTRLTDDEIDYIAENLLEIVK